jgi:hypothetical protein
MNGNGHLSLAEVDRAIQQSLNCEQLFNVKPVLIRAFNAAKNVGGNQTGVMADFVQYKEFRTLLSYLRQYFEFWVMFDRIDTSDDRRISFEEFQQAVEMVQKWGVTITDPRETFEEIDQDGHGMILFDEFANWCIVKSLDLEDDDNAQQSVELRLQNRYKSGPRSLSRKIPKAGSPKKKSSSKKSKSNKAQVISHKSPSPKKSAVPLSSRFRDLGASSDDEHNF